MFYSLLARQQNVSRLLAKSGGERTLTNFLHLAELLQETCRRQQGIEQLYRWLVDCIRRPDRQQTDSSQLRLESDENLVKIVTIHKAKGLEYPVVFLPFLWSTRPCSPKKPFSFHHPDRPEQLCVDLGSGSEEHFALAEREQLAADLRLLYVAITRARYSCYFCWGRISKMNETALCRLLHEGELPDQKTLLDDLGRLHSPEAPLIIKSYPENPVLPTPAGNITEKPLAVTRFTGSIDTSWRITSYSGLTSGHDPRPEQPDYDEQRSLQTQRPGLTVFGFPKGPTAGTCLHAILEKINFTHFADDGTIVAEQLVRAGFKERWQELVSSWMQDILDTELEPGCTLNRLEEQDRINEMAFSFPLENMRLSRFNQVLATYDIGSLPEQQNSLQGLMIGFIDLIFRHKGRYYLADYKSNYLGGSAEDYGQANLRTAMLEHRYDLQYLIYTLALHRFLGSRILDYDYDQHFGGIFYLFLRGMHPNHPPGNGVFFTRPPLALITRLDRCCQGREDTDD
jgi:exodeoxyribonuclease V beta subunit